MRSIVRFLTLQGFKTKMDHEGVDRVYAVGTSALRNAKNSSAVIEKIKSTTGIDISVITGDEEAEMIYRGIQSALDLGSETSLIIDIGAGECGIYPGKQN
jgi:exopolyphosphatase/guanosine-5'-triphosphate,3'-diphosphate pyrophosphatase